MRYEIYRLFPQDESIDYLDEDDDGRGAFEKICAYIEEKKGRLIVIDNLTGVNAACLPQRKYPLNNSQVYHLLMECKMTRLLELERRKDENALIKDYNRIYEALESQAVMEVAHLLGSDTMRELLVGNATEYERPESQTFRV